MKKVQKIDAFFKPKRSLESESQLQRDDEPIGTSSSLGKSLEEREPPLKSARCEVLDMLQPENFNMDLLVRDPGLRPSIDSYPIGQRDEIRRAYVKLGPYQLRKSNYPFLGPPGRRRKFQETWFKSFFWLEYSAAKDAAFCLPCYLFPKNPTGGSGSDTFITKGFNNWRKVNSGKDCPFVSHEGKNFGSAHKYSVSCYENLKNQSGHIEAIMDKQKSEEIMKNRLCLKTIIEAVKWLTFQACAFRGHDERVDSENRGNFLELIKLLASYNKDVSEVLGNVQRNAKYTSPDIQKEILHVFARNVQEAICQEIGKAKFCLLVDEARDESKKEQMAIVVRFVDENGYVKERFLDLIHVKDTSALTLKNEIMTCLAFHKLDVHDIRGQGYDGASNMRGEWNGLQAHILRECPYAYYVHCLAHQLQLALVAASKDVSEVHTFFKNLNFIINVVGSSCKRNDQLQDAQVEEISHLAETGELESGKGANQIRSLQKPGDTRWSSHFNSICSLMNLFGPASVVLDHIVIGRSTSSQRGDASYALRQLLSFDFVLIMHVMKEIMRITNMLCKALQRKEQDIVNALTLVSTTTTLLQKFRDEGWKSLLEDVVSFCASHNISVPDMSANYTDVIRSRMRKDNVTIEHHYRVDVFIVAVDHQLQELNSRFNESVSELLRLSVALDPRDSYKSFNVEDICRLATKFYPSDFTGQERIHLRQELEHYEIDVPHHNDLKNASSVSRLCQGLHKTGKSKIYPLIDRLIRLVLTLPVSTATTERAFSAMKIVKTRLRTSMSEDFLRNYLIVYIERKIAESFSTDKIIDDFNFMKNRRLKF